MAGLIQQAFNDRQPFNFEHRIVRPNGERRTLMARCRVIVDEAGAVVRMVGTAQDVTEWKQLHEELQHAQKMDAVARLGDGIAPDLREVRNASASAAALTRQLLLLKGTQPHQTAAVDLNALISSLENLLRRTLGEHIQIITSLPMRVKPVQGDLAQLRQTIMNLAVNAREAMPHGGTLTIETRHAEPLHSDAVELIVSDTGAGMDAATQSQIFEPFFTTKAPRPAAASLTGTETILLVEDDLPVRQLTARVLREAGYRVLEAPSSGRALGLVKDTAIHIDLLLIDLVLPGLNGVELFEVFRAAAAPASFI